MNIYIFTKLLLFLVFVPAQCAGIPIYDYYVYMLMIINIIIK